MVAAIREDESNVAQTLRVSITGECNLGCFYCKPLGQARDLFTPKSLIQSSDLTKLVKIVADLGVSKVVIQGGEPLLRKDAPNFIKSAYAHKAIQEVRLVTNGTYLKTYADPLRKMGLRKVDINFDSLNFMKYQRITGQDHLYRVLDGLDKVEKLNFPEIRVNVLLLSGINEAEVIDFARMTKDHKIKLRFIEYQPKVTAGDPYADRPLLSVLMAKRMIDNYQRLTQVDDPSSDGTLPAFQFTSGIGTIYFLSEMELNREISKPRILFNADGVLTNEAFPNRPQPILEELRRDAKEDKLHRLIEKVMTMTGGSVKKQERVRVSPQIAARARASKNRRASASAR